MGAVTALLYSQQDPSVAGMVSARQAGGWEGSGMWVLIALVAEGAAYLP